MPGISAWETAAVVYSLSSMLRNNLWDIAGNQAHGINHEARYAELNPVFIFKVS